MVQASDGAVRGAGATGWMASQKNTGNQEEAPQVAGQCSPALLRESTPLLPGHFILGQLAVMGPRGGAWPGWMAVEPAESPTVR
jgi:hypothetical protein